MDRVSYDDTLTKLGDIYHYVMVVKLCFEMDVGDKIYVEQYGDVSKQSTYDSYQMEIKHHKDETNFSDRSTEFWNTLKNWLESKESSEQFKRLLILTTSSIKESSSFFNWDSKNTDDRFRIVKEIGETTKKREKQFRELYNKVFDHPEEDIKEVLNKISFIHSQPNVSKVKSLIKPFLLIVPESKHDLFIDSLVGYVLRTPENPPYSWEITYESFVDVLNVLRDQFTSNGVNLPNTFQEVEIDNHDDYKDRVFVTEIQKIKYEKVINEAINDVWRTNNTIIEYFNDNYIFSKDLKGYKNELNQTLKYLKEDYILNCEDEAERTRVKNSKKFYSNSMLLPANGFGIVKNNWSFFQHGIIHEIVDEGKISWYIQEGENE